MSPQFSIETENVFRAISIRPLACHPGRSGIFLDARIPKLKKQHKAATSVITASALAPPVVTQQFNFPSQYYLNHGPSENPDDNATSFQHKMPRCQELRAFPSRMGAAFIFSIKQALLLSSSSQRSFFILSFLPLSAIFLLLLFSQIVENSSSGMSVAFGTLFHSLRSSGVCVSIMRNQQAVNSFSLVEFEEFRKIMFTCKYFRISTGLHVCTTYKVLMDLAVCV